MKIFLLLIDFEMMRFFLLIYFSFFILVDPWVDDRAAEVDFHCKAQFSSEKVESITSTDREEVESKQQTTHHQKDCMEHSCHLGHCGVLVSERTFKVFINSREYGAEYRQSIPSIPIFSFKRPPKSIA